METHACFQSYLLKPLVRDVLRERHPSHYSSAARSPRSATHSETSQRRQQQPRDPHAVMHLLGGLPAHGYDLGREDAGLLARVDDVLHDARRELGVACEARVAGKKPEISLVPSSEFKQ